MHRVANLNKRANSQAKKKLYQEVGEVQPKGKPGRKKKAGLSAVIPGIPEGETEDTIQEAIVQLKACKKDNPDLVQIRQLIDNTFCLRRRYVLSGSSEFIPNVLKEYSPLKDPRGTEVTQMHCFCVAYSVCWGLLTMALKK